jgi:hypothetical protein
MLAVIIFALMAMHTSRASIPTPLIYDPLFVVVPLAWVGYLIVREFLDTSRSSLGFQGWRWIWIPLITWSMFAVLRGLVRGVDPAMFKTELTLLGLYGTFFAATAGVRRPGDAKLLFAAFLAGMAAVFAEYVLAAVGGASWDLRWGRVISRQANLAAVAAPFVIALFLVRVRHAWWWLIALVPLAMVVLLSQQRALFLAFPIGIVVALAFALRCRRVRKRSIVLLVAGAAVMLSAAWFATGSLTTSGQGGPSVASGVSDRVDETRDGASAPALVIRLISFAWIWENRIVEKPILGWGIGDVATVPILRGNSSKMMRVDNSFVTLWWKSGVIGLALFVGLWTTLFVSAWRLTRHPHPHVQVLAIGVGGTVAALFVLALAASLITHYRFNALWGILMGVVAVAERVYGPREVSHG